MNNAKRKKLILELCRWLRDRGLTQEQVETIPRCILLGFLEGMFMITMLYPKTNRCRFGIGKARPEGIAGHVDYIKFAKEQKKS
jgi:hypothetical protein